MLTAQAVYDLANQHKIRIHNRMTDNEPPQLKSILLWFTEQNPEVWKLLMTTFCEVPVDVRGTRREDGSGATVGSFYPCYRELLPEINAIRKEMGLAEVRN